mmetsp:Transcript_9814/g.29682  ORF Transcript_9814/g.29682 Transcript_9814/m.29682 type:complete len:347 (+) Transcript_9814:581-1621(+)|eukprot:350388-Chlamydomonas_euryale.AAC.12
MRLQERASTSSCACQEACLQHRASTPVVRADSIALAANMDGSSFVAKPCSSSAACAEGSIARLYSALAAASCVDRMSPVLLPVAPQTRTHAWTMLGSSPGARTSVPRRLASPHMLPHKLSVRSTSGSYVERISDTSTALASVPTPLPPKLTSRAPTLTSPSQPGALPSVSARRIDSLTGASTMQLLSTVSAVSCRPGWLQDASIASRLDSATSDDSSFDTQRRTSPLVHSVHSRRAAAAACGAYLLPSSLTTGASTPINGSSTRLPSFKQAVLSSETHAATATRSSGSVLVDLPLHTTSAAAFRPPDSRRYTQHRSSSCNRPPSTVHAVAARLAVDSDAGTRGTSF